ncbi:MAG: sulfotransferase [Hyphomicrobiales bacterium]
MPSPLIHIGLHKTGTSWLQVYLFANPGSGFWNAAPATVTKRKSRAKFGSYFFYRAPDGNVLHEDGFDAAATRAALGVERVPEGQCLVVSNERLSGHPMSNGIDRSWICERLHQTLPQARVVMVVREQRAMILSSYMQYLKYGGPRSIEGFLAPENDARSPALDLGYWDYDRLALTYIRRFGRENLLVLPFEMLRQDPQGFVARICGFAGVAPPQQPLPGTHRENASQNYVTCTALRLLSPLIRSSRGNGFAPSLLGRRVGQAVHLGLQKHLGLLVPRALNERAKRRLFARVEATVGTAYQASNRRLEELTGLDLRRYGYALPEETAPRAQPPGGRDA